MGYRLKVRPAFLADLESLTVTLLGMVKIMSKSAIWPKKASPRCLATERLAVSFDTHAPQPGEAGKLSWLFMEMLIGRPKAEEGGEL